MKYIELLNGFKEIEKETLHGWTIDLTIRFFDLCTKMTNPIECNIITFGDFDYERSEFLSGNEINDLLYIRNRLACSCQKRQQVFFINEVPFKTNFYRTVDDSCIDYVIDVCKRKDSLYTVSEFCNILAVASDVVYDWLDPNLCGQLNREGRIWQGREHYNIIDEIYRQSDMISFNARQKYDILFDELSWKLPWLNACFMRKDRNLMTIVNANKSWINTLASRYLCDPRQRSGQLVSGCPWYDQVYTMLELIWEKLGYEDKFYRRYL